MKVQLEKNSNRVETNGLIPELKIKSYEIPHSDSMKFVHDMKVGWNLGNTFDAMVENPTFTDELLCETAWCGVKTTKELILKLKELGFQTIRIPITWHSHVTGEDYKISEVWLNRVQEVVDYVIEEDMYAIINVHHDVRKENFYPDKEHLESSKHYLVSIWNQLTKQFKAYNNKLIFESINEPYMVGSDYEWVLDMTQDICKEAVECLNQLNQVFVDTVRSSGGNNTYRYLTVPGYAGSAESALVNEFRVPSDSKENDHRIIVNVNAYIPYNFALQSMEEEESESHFDATDEYNQKVIHNIMDRLYDRFISQGIPVLIGEFGARNKNDNLKDRVEYAAFYIASARARGISCCWWDNNKFVGNDENFGLLDRKTLTVQYPDIVDALMDYAE